MKVADSTASITAALTDPAASDWLKVAIRALLGRDPIDAANDADYLAHLFTGRAKALADEADHRRAAALARLMGLTEP